MLALGLECTGMEFSTEIIAKFALAGEHICEVPACIRKDRRTGKSHLRTVREGYVFDGWYLDKDCTQKFDDESLTTVGINLWAKWSEADAVAESDEIE